ncbi:diketogulonate reductase-like aldo/keto reductase [Friedmanniella endophytica]|uniref:Diketogulonate reductase-like aldo/keto reductase n=1 Tax=Microlunatus kandeliicorticis TaxID=1759536 RepID=A0A7W3IVA7_9ACTN|nr:aldo/keto reductase [Microlunatus kandeliicorticis]MBA8795906.1 diketogulonate reductase-like aldo/keto reductase [Microlunatus kandeliicorticis]
MDSTQNLDYAQPAVPVTGGSMPLLGFGTWQIPDEDATRTTAFALESGYRHIDTATGYGNEAGIGKAIAAAGLPREELFVTTKMPPDHVGRERQTLEESLTKLGLDRVDLWLVHWPPNKQATPEAWEHFVAAQSEGLATAIGVSNYSLEQIDELTEATGVTPAVNQIRWAPAIYDPTVVKGLSDRHVVLEGYSPFRASDLDDPTLTRIAEETGATPAQVIVAWHVAHQFVVIPKSSQEDRIRSNAEGARITLTPEQVSAIDGLAG